MGGDPELGFEPTTGKTKRSVPPPRNITSKHGSPWFAGSDGSVLNQMRYLLVGRKSCP